jgi:hypothetical protein
MSFERLIRALPPASAVRRGESPLDIPCRRLRSGGEL